MHWFWDDKILTTSVPYILLRHWLATMYLAIGCNDKTSGNLMSGNNMAVVTGLQSLPGATVRSESKNNDNNGF